MKERQGLVCARRTGAVALLLVGAALVAGCGLINRGRYEKAIRQRHDEFCQAICMGDYGRCVALTAPSSLTENGEKKVEGTYRVLGGIVKLAKLTPADVRIDSLEFNENYTKATLQTSHRLNGEWKAQKPGTWVLENGQWYAKL